jgi:aminoglycoside 3-N-acetyltransferase
MLKSLLLKYSPEYLLRWAKQIKKSQRRKELNIQEQNNSGITKQSLIVDLKKIGLQPGDSVLVHSSLSKIGFVNGGARTVVDALLETIGEEGTLLFPAYPASGRNKDYLKKKLVFDIAKTPSQVGSITEYFRKLNGIFRSFHPTDSVCAKGKLAEFYTNTHYGQLTPYNEFSPFKKLCAKNGKILMLGTNLSSCSNFHTLEDAVDFKYPVYDKDTVSVNMIDYEGKEQIIKTKVHNPSYSSKRDCNAFKPLFLKENVLIEGTIGEAKSMLIDAFKMHEVMLKYYIGKGVTMYTPFGSPT